MDEERLLIDFIEDYEDVNVLQSARHRLLVIKKNLINVKKNIEHCTRGNTDTKHRISICQNRIDFINDDLRSMERLKYNIEAKIAEIIEEIDTDSLPIVYDAMLELFIDQKVEYYSNHVLRHRAVAEKKRRVHAYLTRLQRILDDLNKDLANHQQLADKYNKWIPELRNKQVEMTGNIREIEDDIVAFLEGDSNVSEEINNLIRGRYDIMQDILEEKMKTLMQLNGFSHYVQSECDKSMNAIPDLNEKRSCVQEEINSTMALLEETNIELQTVEMKYSKVEEQVYVYINIQNEQNLVDKCRSYYNLISTYEQERQNAQALLNGFQEKNLNEILQLSSLESSYGNLLVEERQMENTVTSLINALN